MDIACVQETKWKGNKAREIGEGYKLCYSGASRNGVGIILPSEWQDKILEVKRKIDRVMSIKLVVGKRMLNIISAYAPQSHRRDAARKKRNFYMRKWRAYCVKSQDRKTCVYRSRSKWPYRRNKNRI